MAVRNNKKTRISLKEFRAWLDGVEDLQPEEWAPTKDQWEKIRQKIDLIDDKMDLEANDQPKPQSGQVVLNTPQQVNQVPLLPLYQPPRSHFEQAVIIPNPNLMIPGQSGMVVNQTAGVPINLNNPPEPGTEFI